MIVVAGLVAALVSLFELARRRIGLSIRATGWIVLRLSADAAAATLAYPIVDKVVEFPKLVVALLAAATGVSAFRSYVVTIGKGADSKQVGLIRIYDAVQGLADEKIAHRVASDTESWLNNKVEPTLRSVSAQQIVDRIMTYLSLRGDVEPDRMALIRSALERRMAADDSPRSRIELYLEIVALDALDELRKLVRERESVAS